jgi:hypothetical protein
MGFHHAKRKILGTIISNRILIGLKFGNKQRFRHMCPLGCFMPALFLIFIWAFLDRGYLYVEYVLYFFFLKKNKI